MEDTNKKLEEAKDKYVSVIIIGVTKDVTVDIQTTLDNTMELQYLLQRAAFEINVFEMNERLRGKKIEEVPQA